MKNFLIDNQSLKNILKLFDFSSAGTAENAHIKMKKKGIADFPVMKPCIVAECAGG